MLRWHNVICIYALKQVNTFGLNMCLHFVGNKFRLWNITNATLMKRNR